MTSTRATNLYPFVRSVCEMLSLLSRSILHGLARTRHRRRFQGCCRFHQIRRLAPFSRETLACQRTRDLSWENIVDVPSCKLIHPCSTMYNFSNFAKQELAANDPLASIQALLQELLTILDESRHIPAGPSGQHAMVREARSQVQRAFHNNELSMMQITCFYERKADTRMQVVTSCKNSYVMDHV